MTLRRLRKEEEKEGMRNRTSPNKISSPPTAMAEEEKDSIFVEGRRICAAISLLRKKGKGTGGLRSWLVIDATGNAQLLEVGKHAIMRRTGLPARDLRILDPMLSYPSTILGRESAIVINLEHIKAIITADEVLLLNSKDPVVAPFADELQRRLPVVCCMPPQRESGTSDADMETTNNANLSTHPFARDSESTNMNSGGLPQTLLFSESNVPKTSDQKGKGLKSELTCSVNGNGPKILPFEFRALEACLEAACRCLETETTTLEKEAYPALDELTTKISTLNLERVRQIKSRLVAISGRVQKVRDELEHLLDDDDDMAEMYLTEKLIQQQLDETSSLHSFDGTRDEEHEKVQSDAEDESDEAPVSAMHLLGRDDNRNCSRRSRSNSQTASQISNRSGSKSLDVEELEMLLEAYFVQIDGTLNKLSALREYVDDTEDYINIMLDDKQNQLLQMGVMLSTVTLLINCAIVVVGIFGMNIHITLFEPEHAGTPQFVATVVGSIAGGATLYIIAIAWGKKRRLLE